MRGVNHLRKKVLEILFESQMNQISALFSESSDVPFRKIPHHLSFLSFPVSINLVPRARVYSCAWKRLLLLTALSSFCVDYLDFRLTLFTGNRFMFVFSVINSNE